MGHRKTAVKKSRRPSSSAAVIVYQKTVKGTHISSTHHLDAALSREGSGVGGRGASTTMRVKTRTHQSRAAHPPDKVCGALAGEEVRGAEEAVTRGRRERCKKRIQTGIYIINGKWVICMPKSQ